MELRPITIDDLAFYESLLCDPRMMSELGGPLPSEGLAEKLSGIVDEVAAGSVWYDVITPDGDAAAEAGTVCIWEHRYDGASINEIGWMVLPAFQGQGLATRAVDSILHRARAETRWGVVHAFPGTTNAPSNSICRKAGFSMIEECDFGYAGRVLRCNHWRIDLRSALSA